MRNVTKLMEKAQRLKEKGLTTGEIADELNVSKKTALWMVTRKTSKGDVPQDIFIDWSRVGANPTILKYFSIALSELIREIIVQNKLPYPDVIAGIASSGIPIATLIAEDMEASLSIIRPKKHLWEPKSNKKISSFILSNFSDVKDKNVVIVDDIATSGNTLKDTIELLKRRGANPLAAVVLIDKKGIENIGGRPVRALVSIGLIDER